jgi:DnaJ-class molecular chaperone
MICNYCHGHGYTEVERNGETGEIRCPFCGGYGEVQDGNREHKETNRD